MPAEYSFITLDDPLLTQTYPTYPAGTIANGISNNGHIVGYVDYVDEGFMYYGNYTPIAPEANYDGSVQGINDSGAVVGELPVFSAVENRSGYIDVGGTVTTIYDDDDSTSPLGINDSDQVVGIYLSDDIIPEGFLWNNGIFTTINVPGADSTIASGINDQGEIVGSYEVGDGFQNGFADIGGVFTTIDDPFASYGTIVTGVNNKGTIVGYYYDSNNIAHGFIYSAGIYSTISDPSAVQTVAGEGTFIQGINDSGEIVGYYQDSAGTHGFWGSVRPVVTAITSSNANCALRLGSKMEFTISLSEAVTLDGSAELELRDGGATLSAPVLELSDGGRAIFDAANSDLAAGQLVFDYNVRAGQSSSNLSIAKLVLPSGESLVNANGNAANVSNVGAFDFGLAVDTAPPTVNSVQLASDVVTAENEFNEQISQKQQRYPSDQSYLYYLDDTTLVGELASDIDPAGNNFDYIMSTTGYWETFTVKGAPEQEYVPAGYLNPASSTQDFSNQDYDQCGALALSLDPALLPTASQWIEGNQVDLGGVSPGTPIATFGTDEKYLGGNDGGHIGIFLGYWSEGKTDGFLMLDQYVNQPTLTPQCQNAEIRFHPFNVASQSYYAIA